MHLKHKTQIEKLLASDDYLGNIPTRFLFCGCIVANRLIPAPPLGWLHDAHIAIGSVQVTRFSLFCQILSQFRLQSNQIVSVEGDGQLKLSLVNLSSIHAQKYNIEMFRSRGLSLVKIQVHC